MEDIEEELMKSCKVEHSGQEVSTHDFEESTRKDSGQRFESKNRGVDTCSWGVDTWV